MIHLEAWYQEIEAKGMSSIKTSHLLRILDLFGWRFSRKGGEHAEIWEHPEIRWSIAVMRNKNSISGNALRNTMVAMGITKPDLVFLTDKKAVRRDPERVQRLIREAPAKAALAQPYGIKR